LPRPCSDAVGPRAGFCARPNANTVAIAIGYSHGDSYCYGNGYCYSDSDSDSNTYTDSIGCLPTVAGLLEKSSQCLASE